MEVTQVSRMLAYGFVSELIQKNKIKKRKFIGGMDSGEEFETEEIDSANLSFGELEAYYRKVVSVIEDSPDIRQPIVDALKEEQAKGKDLNEFYPSELIASEESLKNVLFINDEPASD